MSLIAERLKTLVFTRLNRLSPLKADSRFRTTINLDIPQNRSFCAGGTYGGGVSCGVPGRYPSGRCPKNGTAADFGHVQKPVNTGTGAIFVHVVWFINL